MTRLFYSLVAILFMLISCQSSSPSADAKEGITKTEVAPDASNTNEAAGEAAKEGAAPASSEISQTVPAVPRPASNPMKPDTIEVRGKYMQGCVIPASIKIAEHNELNSPWKTVTVNANGEFRYRIYLAEPRRIAMKTEKRTMYDFMAVSNEKIYTIEITCTNGAEKIELKNSAENIAYRPFNNANKKFRDDLDSIGKLDLNSPEVFNILKNKINNYQKTLAEISAKYPNTFTGTFLCKAEKLPEGSLSSIAALRKNFLQREVLADPYLYNDFLGQRILLNYLAIYDRKADQSAVLDGMMTIGAKNPDAAKRLQQITYNIFYNRHEEQMIIAFIKWADAHQASMYNATVKASLQRLEHVIPGNQMIDVQLKDPGGTIKKLSETVASGSKLTLLVFYSPTCDHCQAEIPQLKPFWEQYKSKGFRIYTVGFEATDAEWHNFIGTKGSPEWTNVFEYPNGTMYSYQYVVNYTPTYIFINPQGKIIKRFPTFEDVKRDLPQLMAD